jgi:hypothetical protein
MFKNIDELRRLCESFSIDISSKNLEKFVFITLNTDGINMLNYPILVTEYEKKNCGRSKRAYQKIFNSDEKERIGRYYKLFYNWYLRTGPPESYKIKLENLKWLVEKVIPFFASL